MCRYNISKEWHGSYGKRSSVQTLKTKVRDFQKRQVYKLQIKIFVMHVMNV